MGKIPVNLPIITSYGLTETASLFIADGFPLPGKEIELRDGEIFLKGDSLFQGYFNGKTVEKQEGWFPTKDLATFDPKKGFSIIGRKDNLFISGGENIQPEEIEQKLLELPSILEAIVVPKEDPEFGARPIAWIRSTSPIDPEALSKALSEHLPKFKIPIHFLDLDQIPQNNLKISRKKLYFF